MAEIIRFQLRRDTSANWATFNPVLADGEPAIERDTGRQKLGNGVTPWNSLPYASINTAEVQGALDAAASAASDASLAELRRADAEAAKQGAEAARDAAQAVPATTDGLVKSLLQNPASDTARELTATYVGSFPDAQSITYNGDGSVATVTENGITTSYTYNGDGTVAADSRTVDGVTTTRNYGYTNGNLTSITKAA